MDPRKFRVEETKVGSVEARVARVDRIKHQRKDLCKQRALKICQGS